ncbi:MAG TPA: hypothetical protein PK691_12315, partial [Thermomicrobiales bacterium]|nr:hypothetical protein [Thermomicrobiales bacterium]
MVGHSRRTFIAGSTLAASTLMPLGRTVLAQDATPEATPIVVAPQAALPAEWGEVQGEWAEINGNKLHYAIYGEDEPLVLLHGGLG